MKAAAALVAVLALVFAQGAGAHASAPGGGIAAPGAKAKAAAKAKAQARARARKLSDANLLQNGSFEASVAGWAGYSGKLSLIGDAAVGAKAALVTATAAGTVSIYPVPRPLASTPAGVAYTARAWAKASPKRTICLVVREWAASVAGSAERCVTTTGAWQELPAVTFTTLAAGHSLEAYVYEKGAARGTSYLVDGISLTPPGPPAPPPPPPPPPPPAPPAAGAFYVAPAGSDSNSGSKDAPWRTIQKAFDTLAAGQTAYLRAGSYGEWVQATRSGRDGAPITVTAYPGETPTITGRFKISGSYIRFSRLHFLGGTAANNTNGLLYVSGGDHVEVLSNEFERANMSAIYLGDPGNGSDYAVIEGNYIHDNGTHYNLDHGIYYGTGQGGRIVNNVIVRNFARGIQCYPDCDGATIANNTVAANGRAGISVGDEAGSSSDNVTIVNNVVASNGDIGIRPFWGGTPGVNVVARNNLAWANAGGDYAGAMTFVGNRSADPLFVGAGDYRLSAGSPALDTALADFAPAVDFTGAARGAAPDLGAYER